MSSDPDPSSLDEVVADDGGWSQAWAVDPDEEWVATHGPATFVAPVSDGAFVEYALASGRHYFVNSTTLEHAWDIGLGVPADGGVASASVASVIGVDDDEAALAAEIAAAEAADASAAAENDGEAGADEEAEAALMAEIAAAETAEQQQLAQLAQEEASRESVLAAAATAQAAELVAAAAASISSVHPEMLAPRSSIRTPLQGSRATAAAEAAGLGDSRKPGAGHTAAKASAAAPLSPAKGADGGEYAYEGLSADYLSTGPWLPPTVERAKAYRAREVFGGGRAPLCVTRELDLAPLGPGVVLYFKLLSFLVLIFSILTLLSVPLFLVAAVGSRSIGNVADPYYAAFYSVGNVGEVHFTDISAKQDAAASELAAYRSARTCGSSCTAASNATLARLAPMWESYDALSWPEPLDFILAQSPVVLSKYWGLSLPSYVYLTWLISGFDLFGCVVLLVGVALMRARAKRFTDLIAQKMISASNYSISVSGLPPDCTVNEVRDHFSALFSLDGTGCSASGNFTEPNFAKASVDESRRRLQTEPPPPVAPLSTPTVAFKGGVYAVAPPLGSQLVPRDPNTLRSLIVASAKAIERRRKLGIVTEADPDVDFKHRVEVFARGPVPPLKVNPVTGALPPFPHPRFVGTWVAGVELVRPMANIFNKYKIAEDLHAQLRNARAVVKMYSPGTPLPTGENKAQHAKAVQTVEELSSKLEVLRKQLGESQRASAARAKDHAQLGNAFVTFEHEESYQRCLKAYAGSGRTLAWLQAPHLRFRSPASPGFFASPSLSSCKETECIPYSSIATARESGVDISGLMKHGRVVADDARSGGGIAWEAYAHDAWSNGGAGYAITVKPAPDPSDVIHENLEYTRTQKYTRRGLTLCATLLAVGVGLGVMFLSSYLMRLINANAPTLSICETIIPELFFNGSANLAASKERLSYLSSTGETTGSLFASGNLATRRMLRGDGEGGAVAGARGARGARGLASSTVLAKSFNPTLARLSGESLRAAEDAMCSSGSVAVAYRYDLSAGTYNRTVFMAEPAGLRFPFAATGDAVPYGIPSSACSSAAVGAAAADAMGVASAAALTPGQVDVACPDPRVLSASASAGVGGFCPCIVTNVPTDLSAGKRCQSLACFGPQYASVASSPCTTFPSTTLVGCYCMAALRELQTVKGTIDGLLAFSRNEASACSTFTSFMALSSFVAVLSGLASTAVNIFLYAVIPWLTSFEVHASLSGREKQMSIKLAVALTVNTALFAVIVNWRLPTTYSGAIPSWLRALGLLGGTFDDFTMPWYAVTGATIISTMVANTLMTPMFMLYEYMHDALARAAVHGRIGAVPTQGGLDELYVGARFKVSDKYPVVLSMVVVSLLFSTGLPILLPLVAIGLALQYIVDKAMLLRFYRKPPAYDASMFFVALDFIPFAVVAHLLFGFWMLTTPAQLPSVTISPALILRAGDAPGNALLKPFLAFFAYALDVVLLSLAPYDTMGILPRALKLHGLVFVVLALVTFLVLAGGTILRWTLWVGWAVLSTLFYVASSLSCTRALSQISRSSLSPVMRLRALLQWRANVREARLRSEKSPGWVLTTHIEDITFPAVKLFLSRVDAVQRGMLSEALFFRMLRNESEAVSAAGLGECRMDGDSTGLGKGLAPFSQEFSSIYFSEDHSSLTALEVSHGWRVQEVDAATLEDTLATNVAFQQAALRSDGAAAIVSKALPGFTMPPKIPKHMRRYRGAAALTEHPAIENARAVAAAEMTQSAEAAAEEAAAAEAAQEAAYDLPQDVDFEVRTAAYLGSEVGATEADELAALIAEASAEAAVADVSQTTETLARRSFITGSDPPFPPILFFQEEAAVEQDRDSAHRVTAGEFQSAFSVARALGKKSKKKRGKRRGASVAPEPTAAVDSSSDTAAAAGTFSALELSDASQRSLLAAPTEPAQGSAPLGAIDDHHTTVAAASDIWAARAAASRQQNSIFSEDAPAVATGGARSTSPALHSNLSAASSSVRFSRGAIAKVAKRSTHLILRQFWTPASARAKDGASLTSSALPSGAERAGRARKSWEVIAATGLHTYDIAANPIYAAAFVAAADAERETAAAEADEFGFAP